MQIGNWLVVSLVFLAAGLAANSALGPLWLEVIDYRYSETILNQAIGLDAVSLFVAVPLAGTAAVLVRRGQRFGPILSLGPAAYALYMMPQYVIGPEYGVIEGNNERFFALHFALFITAGVVFALAWNAVTLRPAQFTTGRRRAATAFLLAFPVFMLLGMYLASFADALSSAPSRDEYLDNPTAFWLIAFLDLAVVSPVAVASGLGLRAGVNWAARGALTVVGWFALVPPSVAAMSLAMVANDDPNGSAGRAVAFVLFAVVFAAFAVWFYWPLAAPTRTKRMPPTPGTLPLPRA